jgi:anthranilate phosphoribosyltransferase
MDVSLKPYLEKLIARQNLSEAEVGDALERVIAGVLTCSCLSAFHAAHSELAGSAGCDSHQTAAFLTLLRAKGETAEEVAGLARAR